MNLAPLCQAECRLDDINDDERDVLATVDAAANTARATDLSSLGAPQHALLELGRWLQSVDYQFTTVTPLTHQEWIARHGGHGRTLRDVFGWSRLFKASLLPPPVLALLRQAGVLLRRGDYFRSAVRFASLGNLLVVHSAHPTDAANSVFFGPDSYRFAKLIQRALGARQDPLHTIADVGCGSGVGGLLAAHLLAPCHPRLFLADISSVALRYAAVNAHLAGLPEARCLVSDMLGGLSESPDLVLCNPPYLVDDVKRLYRDGGGALGCGLAIRAVDESLAALAPGGQLVLYTGAPVIDGTDMLWDALRPLLGRRDIVCEYEEIDPDVFGEELRCAAYCDVERIAAVGLVLKKH